MNPDTPFRQQPLTEFKVNQFFPDERPFRVVRMQKVKEMTKGDLNITEGALYPALHKLEAEGLLDVEVEKVDNRLRKYYKLTEKGTTETVNRLAELEDFIRNMQTIVNPKLSY